MADELLYNPFDPAFRADPYPAYDRLRTEAPAWRSPLGLIVLTRYDDVVETLRSNRVSRDIEANATPRDDEVSRRRRERARQRAKTILNLEPGLRVVGEATDGEAGIRQALDLRPDVILMDVQMPGMSGIEAIAAICAVWPDAKIIILTTFGRDEYVFQGVRAGAMGFLLKD